MTSRSGSSRLGALVALATIEWVSLTGLPNDLSAQSGGETLEFDITGIEHVWYVRYPGADGELGTSDDRMGRDDLYLPAGSKIRLLVNSEDYIYRLFSPGIELSKMAIPRREVVTELAPLEEGVYELEGEPMCGLKLGDMVGHVVVQAPSEFARWQTSALPFEDSFGRGETVQ